MLRYDAKMVQRSWRFYASQENKRSIKTSFLFSVSRISLGIVLDPANQREGVNNEQLSKDPKQQRRAV